MGKYWGYIGIMEKKMGTIGVIGVISFLLSWSSVRALSEVFFLI